MIGKILIVDDVSSNRIVFKVKLTAAGYQTLGAADGEGALRLALGERPDIILLNLSLGLEVLAGLKSHPQTRRIPLIVVADPAAAPLRAQALEGGAEDFLTRPIDDSLLQARLRAVLRMRQALTGMGEGAGQDLGVLGLAEPRQTFALPGQIALVLPQADKALRLRRDLAALGQDRFVVMAPEEVHANPACAAPDVYLIPADLGEPGGGLRVMSELLARHSTRTALFCIWAPDASATPAATAFDLGAHEVVDETMPTPELALRLHRLVARKREGDRMRASVENGLRLAVYDPLTGLHNRRYGMAQLTAIADRAAAGISEFAVLVVDIDRFKSVNDRWGHAAGDAVLLEVARRLSQCLRPSDLLARIGGEEFLIALPATPLVQAQDLAQSLCRAVDRSAIELADGTRAEVTISIGMTTGGGGPADPVQASDLVAQADRALMHSKTHGRNQVTIVRRAA
ncbi:MAG: diguanylate cyclase [Pseudomonadota bacterium]